jgi:hypothetical protein
MFSVSFISFIAMQWVFVGRYWKVALYMPYAIQPYSNMKKPEVHIFAKAAWWLVLIVESSLVISAIVI